MKRNLRWIIAVLILLAVIAFLVFPIGKPLELPFAAEDVSSVILWSFWGYKEVTGREEIAMIVEKMQRARICGEFDFENYEMREGDYSYTGIFYLHDGSTYEYKTMPIPGLTSLFQNADGTYYRAKNISFASIYEKLTAEAQTGNPFKTQ